MKSTHEAVTARNARRLAAMQREYEKLRNQYRRVFGCCPVKLKA
jgi:hypothetical protein